MKKLLILFLALCLCPIFGTAVPAGHTATRNARASVAASETSSSDAIVDCKCKGIPLYGRVRVVTIDADFDVRVVQNFGDLRVETVTIAPNSCGQWQFVDIGEDFTIEFVDIGEDFTIEYVTIAPGTSSNH